MLLLKAIFATYLGWLIGLFPGLDDNGTDIITVQSSGTSGWVNSAGYASEEAKFDAKEHDIAKCLALGGDHVQSLEYEYQHDDMTVDPETKQKSYKSTVQARADCIWDPDDIMVD